MRRILWLVGALLVVSLGLGAAPKTWTSPPTPPAYRPDQAPGTAAQIARGEKVYETCAICHGPEGEGRVGEAPRLRGSDFLAIVPNRYLQRTIAEGRPGTDMIPWGGWLPPQDIEAVVAYLRSWQENDGVILDQSALDGDEEEGAELYAQKCASCHGATGLGYAEEGSGIAISRYQFLSQVSDGQLRALIYNGKSATPMQGFGRESPYTAAPLTAREVDSLIVWLRKNPR